MTYTKGKQKATIYKAFKSKVNSLEGKVFESGAMKHVAQSTKTLEEIAIYIHEIYNRDVINMIKDMEHPVFDFPV